MAVYLDHAATTPMTRTAIDAYANAAAVVGNPASIHRAGQNAKAGLETARESLAVSLRCEPIEVILTSGGTESINLALKGLFWEARRRDPARRRILVPGGEHHATIDAVEWLEHDQGAVVEWLPLTEDGGIDLTALEHALREPGDIALVSCLAANNEVGTVQPIDRVAALADRAGVPLHVDAVAAFGQLPVDFRAWRGSATGNRGLVAFSVSAHKLGGPVAVGALVLSRHAGATPLIHGGGQQRQVRSGTQDVAGASAFAAAAAEAVAALPTEAARLARLRDDLIEGVRRLVPEARLNGPQPDSGRRLPGNAHFFFPGAQGDSLLFLLDAAGIRVSTGSACQAGVPEPSHVLIAMGADEREASSVIRVTLGTTTTTEDVEALLAALPAAYAQSRSAAPA